MGRRIVWARSALFKEIDGPLRGDVLFRYPARASSSAAFVFAIAFGLVGLFGRRVAGPRQLSSEVALLFSFLMGTFALVCLFLALHYIWTQRVLEVSRDRREIALLRKSLFTRSRDAVPFSSLRSISLVVAPDSLRPPEEWQGRVIVIMEDEAHLILGRGAYGAATAFALRLSALTGIPYDGARAP